MKPIRPMWAAAPGLVEIYNPNPYPVDLAGYYISDKHENPTKWMVPLDNDSTVVDAELEVFWADEDGLQGWNHTSFKLKDSGEELGIYSPDGFTAADEVAQNTITIPNDVSMGRETDGAETLFGSREPPRSIPTTDNPPHRTAR